MFTVQPRNLESEEISHLCPEPSSSRHNVTPYDAIKSNHTNPKEKLSSTSRNKIVQYWRLLSDNSNFRWFLLSTLVTTVGEWLTYVASIAAIEEIHSSNNEISRTSISILVILRLLPNSLFAPIGGALADSFDRRTIIFILDVTGALVVWLYVFSYYMGSISAIYLSTILQMTIGALHEPCHSAIIPMLVPEEDSLEKAVIMLVSSYALMQALGSSIGGFLTDAVGIQYCFMIDSFTYIISAFLVWKIRGEYNPVEPVGIAEKSANLDIPKEKEERWFSLSNFTKMTNEGTSYLFSQTWGAFVLLKFFAALIYGSADVLNVSFAEQHESSNEINISNSSNQRLGILFAFVGIGCVLGPVLIENFTQMESISSLERACLASYLIMGLGYSGLWQYDQFILICIFSAVRSAGSTIVWTYSSLLLQKLSSSSMRGRVFAVDYALATLSESLSALIGGVLQDNADLTAAQVSLIMAIIAVLTLFSWIVYFARVEVRNE